MSEFITPTAGYCKPAHKTAKEGVWPRFHGGKAATSGSGTVVVLVIELLHFDHSIGPFYRDTFDPPGSWLEGSLVRDRTKFLGLALWQ
jgi:hypothetical protein